MIATQMTVVANDRLHYQRQTAGIHPHANPNGNLPCAA